MAALPRWVAALAALALTFPVTASAQPAPDVHPDATGVEAGVDWRRVGVRTLTASPATVASGAPARGPVRVVTVTEQDSRPQITVTEVEGRAAAVEAIAAAQADPEVLGVELDSEVRALQIPTPPWNDTYRSFQWSLDRLSAEEAHARVGDVTPVLVAVVDSGVDASVPDLAGLVVPGFDYFDPTREGLVDDFGHGTNVASILAARADNGTGMAGYNQAVTVLPVKVLDETGSGSSSDVALGVMDATDAGADVINMSLGGSSNSAALQTAIEYARSQGAVLVAAAGNQKLQGNPVTYPAAYDGVLAVGATTPSNAIGSFSNTGDYLDLVAPGTEIVVLGLGGGAFIGQGTSYASPYAAGVAAQLLAVNPALTADQIGQALTTTALDLGTPGWDQTFGHGLINPLSALCSVGVCATSPGAPTSASAVAGNGEVALTWQAPASDGGTPVRGYTVTRSPGGQSVTLAATARSTTVTGLANGTAYDFSIQAVNSVGASAPATVQATPRSLPAAPGGVTATAGDQQATVTWTAPDDGGSPITAYTVTASPGGTQVTVAAPATAATVTGLTNGTAYTFTVTATNGVGTSPASTPSAPVTPTAAAADLVSRLAGGDRYATAAEIAAQFPAGGAVLYVASGQDFPDALAGAALAGTDNAPVLLVRAGSIPAATQAALAALQPQRIVILGGTGSVSTTVATQLAAYATANTPDEVTRLAGLDRYGTAAAIAGQFPLGGEVLYVASGQNFPDALAGAALAGTDNAPVLLVRSGTIPPATQAALAALQPQRIVILGGTSSVNVAVATQLAAYATANTADEVTRLQGLDRYGTAAVIAGQFPLGGEVLYVASGQNFPDALAGAALAGTDDAPVLLVRAAAIPPATQATLGALNPARIVILGGTGSVSPQVEQELEQYAN